MLLSLFALLGCMVPAGVAPAVSYVSAVAPSSLPDLDTPLRTGAQAPEDSAVVVGLEDYVFVPDVPYAARDSRLFYDWLVQTRGVPAARVRLIERSGSREQILAALDSATAEVGAGGTLWFYFAGHGAADASTSERMLLGDDVRSDPAVFGARSLTLSEIKSRVKTGNLALVLDACYNGLGRGGQELVAGKRFLVPAYASVPQTRVLEWTAAGPDQMSGPIDAVQHGAFTYFAVGALRGWADGVGGGTRDGKVSADEAAIYVRDALRTVQINSQTPVLTVSDPATWVLESGANEAAPPLTAPTTSTANIIAVNPQPGIDPRDTNAVAAAMQQVVDSCTAANWGDSAVGETWNVQFTVKEGAPRWLFINNPTYWDAPPSSAAPAANPPTSGIVPLDMSVPSSSLAIPEGGLMDVTMIQGAPEGVDVSSEVDVPYTRMPLDARMRYDCLSSGLKKLRYQAVPEKVKVVRILKAATPTP